MSWLKNLGSENKSLNTIHEHFIEMLERGAEAYRHGYEGLFDREEAANHREPLEVAESRTDELMQSIRRELVVHGTVHGASTFPDLLVLMSLAKDAERIGDNSKNLLGLGLLGPDLGDDDERAALQRKGGRLLELRRGPRGLRER